MLLKISLDDRSSCANLEVAIEHGMVSSLEPCLYQITFNEAMGGQTKAFGKTIRDRTPQNTNDVNIRFLKKEVAALSYHDIMNLPGDTIKIYHIQD